MKDGTPITIVARSEFEIEECLRQGLRPLEEKKKDKKRPAPRAAKKAGTGKK